MRTVKKILVIRLSSIGDIILTTPLLRALSIAYPEVTIDYCTKAPFVSLLASNPLLSKVYTTENVPDSYYDLVVDLQNNIRSRTLIRSLKSPKSVHYRKENWKKWVLVHLKLNLYGEYRSVVQRYADALQDVALSVDHQQCELYVSADDEHFAASYAQSETTTLALCFGAKHFTKRYPPQHFATIVTRLHEHFAVQVLLLGGAEDAPYAIELLNFLPDRCRGSVINLAGRCSLMQTAALLSHCDAVLCNDTGLMHLASAFKKKLFVLFGSSSQAFGFLPWQTSYELFEVGGLPCKPCSHIGRDKCPKGHFRCMNDLSPHMIADHIIAYFKSLQA